MSSIPPSDSNASAESDAASRIGSTVADRYIIEGVLGEGGMGAVYLVQHKSLRKKLALKLLHPEYVRNPTVLARFEREAVAAAHLSHPNVASASDFGRTDDGHFFLVLEYIEGRELREVLTQAQGPLPLARALFITRQILAALVRANELGIVHRDLKPENIMLVKGEGHSDYVKVLDFGLAHVPRKVTDEPAAPEAPEGPGPRQPGSPPRGGSKITKVGDIIGTPAYMAPEQSVGDATDVRSDLYSLGIIVYEMLAGTRPFTGKSLLVLMQQHLTIPPPPFSESAPAAQIPKAIEDLVRRLLAKDPSERFQTPQAVLDAVDAAMQNLSLRWPLATGASASQSHDAVTRPLLPAIHRALTAIRHRSVTLIRGPAPLPEGADPKPTWQQRLLTALRLPPPLRDRLLATPRWPWIVVALTLLMVICGVTVLAVRSPAEGTTSEGKARPPFRLLAAMTQVSQAEIDTAAAQGVPALQTLIGRHPSDPRIRRAVIRSHIAARRYADMLSAIAELAAIDPTVGHDLEIIQGIVGALNDPATSGRAADLLERELGEPGVELLYDLTTRQTNARWKSRLAQSLTKPEVLALASPALRIAIELRNAKRCEVKHNLLPRAQSEGDARVLALLRGLAQPQGCGFLGLQDCWPCLRKTPALRDAIAALETRLGPAGATPDKP